MCGRFLQLLLLAFAVIPITVFQSTEARDQLIEKLKELMDQIMVQERILHRKP
ncbi:TyeA family type III secretion system gatekeeper subunit [Providencia rettgeri]|nr:hypothetical protein [Providencia rettgeri]